ncbi:hypothetical protein ETB97_004610 [Aspergillus alliaceus]|uniref:Uncharacterized protein n=1 Tax=Petromyces alliaceus TaxID=209559 RepID=A0A8H6A091_PETAA|nr:hypothetical protein ETB97_004610 [Aspergillus burnettii]
MEGTLPYLKGQPEIIFFTDFDGTITLEDCNDFLVDYLGFGYDKRQVLERELNAENISFRVGFKDMLDSVEAPFSTCLQALKENIKLDPHFVEFYRWAQEHNIPVVILSSGMEPVITELLKGFLGSNAENIFVVANDVESRDGKDINIPGGWQVKFRDSSHFGHDKSLAIRPYAALPDQQRPLLLYAGDGASDLSAASETDILFAKTGLGLVKYCERKGIPFVPFDNWASIHATVKEIFKARGGTNLAAIPEDYVRN